MRFLADTFGYRRVDDPALVGAPAVLWPAVLRSEDDFRGEDIGDTLGLLLVGREGLRLFRQAEAALATAPDAVAAVELRPRPDTLAAFVLDHRGAEAVLSRAARGYSDLMSLAIGSYSVESVWEALAPTLYQVARGQGVALAPPDEGWPLFAEFRIETLALGLARDGSFDVRGVLWHKGRMIRVRSDGPVRMGALEGLMSEVQA